MPNVYTNYHSPVGLCCSRWPPVGFDLELKESKVRWKVFFQTAIHHDSVNFKRFFSADDNVIYCSLICGCNNKYGNKQSESESESIFDLWFVAFNKAQKVCQSAKQFILAYLLTMHINHFKCKKRSKEHVICFCLNMLLIQSIW